MLSPLPCSDTVRLWCVDVVTLLTAVSPLCCLCWLQVLGVIFGLAALGVLFGALMYFLTYVRRRRKRR